VAENEDGDGDVSGEEAAWRDLIARFDLPVDTTTRQAPWPAREDLAEPSADRQLPEHDTAVGREQGGAGGPAGPVSRAGPASLPGPAGGPGPLRVPGSGLPGPPRRGGQDGPDDTGQGAASQDGTGPAGADRDGIDPDITDPGDDDGIGWGSTILDDDWGSNGRPRTGLTDGRDAGTGSAGTGRDGADPAGGRSAGDRAHIVRRAEPVPRPAPPGDDDDDDDRYVPPPPAPLPQLDSVAKGAWVALLGGPGYLLLATLTGWQIADWAALVAIIAFVAGFATLVLRMSDRPRDDDDDGAVV
jgi:hypothetical protein